jgi:hypothetical protein
MLDRLDDAKDRALWATAIYAGLRRGELTALHRATAPRPRKPGPRWARPDVLHLKAVRPRAASRVLDGI